MRTLAVVSVLALSLAGPALAAPAPPSKDAAKPPAAVGSALAGDTPAEVRARLGEPAVASEEGKGAFWTYRLDDCALMVFFRDDGAGLRVSSVGAGPRKRADKTPDADACIADAGR